MNVVYDERFGGPQSRILQVACALRQENIETIVVTRRGDPWFPRLLGEAGVQHFEFPLVRLRRSLNPIDHCAFAAGFWANVTTLRALIREFKVDLVHNNGALNFQAPIAARLECVPLVWHLNDVYLPTALRGIVPQAVVRWSDTIAVASRAVAEYYFGASAESGGRIAVLYPPVDTDRFRPGADGGSLREELGIDSATPLIVTAANLCPEKGFESLLYAAWLIARIHPDAMFLIAGAALRNREAYRRKLLRLRGSLKLDDHVKFLGARRDIHRILAAADIYVHPSEREAAPMAVMEASASGAPIVGTDVGGTREIVADGVTGLLVPPRTPEALAAKVLELMDCRARAVEMGRRGAERMRELFSLPICVARHRDVYSSALGRISSRVQPNEGKREAAGG